SHPRPTPDISTLSLHDALPIFVGRELRMDGPVEPEVAQAADRAAVRLVEHRLQLLANPRAGENADVPARDRLAGELLGVLVHARSEEHTSELQSRGHLVCRLLL